MVSVVCWASLLTSYSVSNAQTLDPNQIYSTGNIVQPTTAGSNTTPWVNGVYQNNLTCWGGGDPGNCGPNPTVRPEGFINFSYGTANLYQMQAISSALENSGTGLRVNGFNYGFTAKNGNGWDDGRQDYLSAYVKFYGSTGNVVENYDYTSLTNRKYNWTQFNFSETFTTPYASKDLSTVQYGLIGRDNNFWAGTYGPEVYNVSFSLKYSAAPDPCVNDPLYSPTCRGYAVAYIKNQLLGSTVAAASAPQITAINPPPQGDPNQPPQGNPPPQGQNGPPGSQGDPRGGPQGDPNQPQQNNQAGPPPPPNAQASVNNPAPSANNPQPRVGEVAGSGGGQQQQSRSSSGPSMSTIMNILSTESTRVGNVERAVVQQATSEAKTASEKAIQEGESVASSLTTTSVASSMSQTSGSGLSLSNSATQSKSDSSPSAVSNSSIASISTLRTPQSQQSFSADYTIDSNRSTQQQTYTVPSFKFEPQNNQSLNSSFEYKPVITKQQEFELPKEEGLKMTGRSPLGDYMQSKPFEAAPQTNTSQQSSSVKQNVSDNDAAGGVSIAMMARMPPGYELYSMGIKDAAFYPPKEVYRNQRVVDNARVERFMNAKSDALHQQMVDEQYNKGK